MLLALALTAVLALLLGWSRSDGEGLVAVVDKVQGDLPTPHLPGIERGWIGEMSGSACAISLLGLLEAVAIAKSIANQTRQRARLQPPVPGRRAWPTWSAACSGACLGPAR